MVNKNYYEVNVIYFNFIIYLSIYFIYIYIYILFFFFFLFSFFESYLYLEVYTYGNNIAGNKYLFCDPTFCGMPC